MFARSVTTQRTMGDPGWPRGEDRDSKGRFAYLVVGGVGDGASDRPA
jgi:hypothetical protein